MARSKFPKKTTDLKDPVSNPGAVHAPNSNGAAAEIAAPPEAGNRESRNTTRKSAAKPEIVKTEPRSNLLPINLEDEIRSLAYLLAERRGFEAGHETEDWLAAEREVRQRYRQQSA